MIDYGKINPVYIEFLFLFMSIVYSLVYLEKYGSKQKTTNIFEGKGLKYVLERDVGNDRVSRNRFKRSFPKSSSVSRKEGTFFIILFMSLK